MICIIQVLITWPHSYFPCVIFPLYFLSLFLFIIFSAWAKTLVLTSLFSFKNPEYHLFHWNHHQKKLEIKHMYTQMCRAVFKQAGRNTSLFEFQRQFHVPKFSMQICNSDVSDPQETCTYFINYWQKGLPDSRGKIPSTISSFNVGICPHFGAHGRLSPLPSIATGFLFGLFWLINLIFK